MKENAFSSSDQGNLELAMKEEEKRRSKTALIQNAIAGLKAKLDEVGAQQDDSAELARRLAQVRRPTKLRISGRMNRVHCKNE